MSAWPPHTSAGSVISIKQEQSPIYYTQLCKNNAWNSTSVGLFSLFFFFQHNIAIKNIPNLAAQLDENAFQKSLNYSKFLQRTQCPIFLRLLGQNSKLRFTYGHYVSSANGSVYVVQSGRPPPRRTKILFLELLRTTAFARGRQWLQRRKRAHKNGLSADYTKKLTKLV